MRLRIIGIITVALGVLAIAIAVAGLLGGDGTSGDVDAVEAALRPDEPAPITLGPPPTTTTAARSEIDDTPAPTTTTQAPPVADPVGLRIQSLEVDAPVDPYGVDSRGQMDVPDNVTDVAWYKFGPKPGEGLE